MPPGLLTCSDIDNDVVVVDLDDSSTRRSRGFFYVSVFEALLKQGGERGRYAVAVQVPRIRTCVCESLHCPLSAAADGVLYVSGASRSPNSNTLAPPDERGFSTEARRTSREGDEDRGQHDAGQETYAVTL